MLVVLVATLAVPPPCPLTHACTCYSGGQHVPQKDPTKCTNCSKCHPGDSVVADDNLYCKPLMKQCQMCGSPTPRAIANKIGPGYTLHIRQSCTNFSAAPATLDAFYLELSLVGDLTIDGYGATLSGPCPSMIFRGPIGSITLKNMTIDCKNATMDIAPGILVQSVTDVTVEATDVKVNRHAKSAITVLGGIEGEPLDLKTKLTATFADVSLNTSVYRIWTDLTLAMYYGDVDVSGMGNRRRIAVQPALDPATETASPLVGSPKSLIVYNFSEWTRMFGQDYEVFVFDPTGATLGFALQEVSYEQAQIMYIGISIIVGGVLIILLRYSGPVWYLYKLAKA